MGAFGEKTKELLSRREEGFDGMMRGDVRGCLYRGVQLG
jgi:hypothetical protein